MVEWFKDVTYEDNIIFYTSSNALGKEGKSNIEAFSNVKTLEGDDVGNKLRVLIALNQEKEGLSAPNVDGVIIGKNNYNKVEFFELLASLLSVNV